MDGINYSFCDEVRQRTVLHFWGRNSNGSLCQIKVVATFISFARVMHRLSCIFVEFKDVLPFSKTREMFDSGSSASQAEELANQLAKLRLSEESGLTMLTERPGRFRSSSC